MMRREQLHSQAIKHTLRHTHRHNMVTHVHTHWSYADSYRYTQLITHTKNTVVHKTLNCCVSPRILYSSDLQPFFLVTSYFSNMNVVRRYSCGLVAVAAHATTMMA